MSPDPSPGGAGGLRGVIYGYGKLAAKRGISVQKPPGPAGAAPKGGHRAQASSQHHVRAH